MLRPDEFFIGTLSVAKPLSLVLPRSRYEQPMIVVGTPENPTAVFLGMEHQFDAMPCNNNTSWHGLVIPNVKIEVDLASMFDPDQEARTPGCLVRDVSGLAICAVSSDRYSLSGLELVPIPAQVPDSDSRMTVGFRRWAIVLGEGESRRTLRFIGDPEGPGPVQAG